MVPFEGKVLQAYFFDKEFKVIKVLWEDDEKVVREYVLEHNEEDASFQALVKEGWDLGKIHDDTISYKRKEKESFKQMMTKFIEMERLDEVERKVPTGKVLMGLIDMKEEEINADQIFQFKLELFEEEKILNLQDRELKSELRKAKTYRELIELVLKIGD